MPSKKRVNVMLHDRLTARVTELAETLHLSPNDLVNRIVEGALAQVDQTKKPRDPLPIVNLARIILRKNLGPGDRWVQKVLESKVTDWSEKTKKWREVLRRLAIDSDGELTNDEIEKLKRRADKICAQEGD